MIMPSHNSYYTESTINGTPYKNWRVFQEEIVRLICVKNQPEVLVTNTASKRIFRYYWDNVTGSIHYAEYFPPPELPADKMFPDLIFGAREGVEFVFEACNDQWYCAIGKTAESAVTARLRCGSPYHHSLCLAGYPDSMGIRHFMDVVFIMYVPCDGYKERIS